MTATTICATTACEGVDTSDASTVSDTCWMAAATACAEKAFSDSGCAKCDWSDRTLGAECMVAMGDEIHQVCNKPKKVKQGMKMAGVTADNFESKKAGIKTSLSAVTQVPEEFVDVAYIGSRRRLQESDDNNIEASYDVPEDNVSDLNAALTDSNFMANMNTALTNNGVEGVTVDSVSAPSEPETVTTTTEAATTETPTTTTADATTADPNTAQTTPQASAGALSMIAAFVSVLFM